MIKKVSLGILGIVAIGIIITVGKSYNFNLKHENILNLSINNPLKTFDPAIVFNDDGLTVIGQSLETLYQYHYLKRPYEVIPSLASDLPRVSENGTVYTIKIKKNILYQNSNKVLPEGRTVKAEDFVWAIKRIAFKPIKSTGRWLFEGKIKGFNEFGQRAGTNAEKFYTEKLEGVKAVNDHTLEITLTKPEPNLLYFLAMNFTSPTPVELLKFHKNDLSKVLVGTGAYYLKESSEKSYYFERFKDFHEEFYPAVGDRYANTQDLLSSSKQRLPFLSGVKFTVLANEDLRWERFQKGEVDIINLPQKFLTFMSQLDNKLHEELNDLNVEVKHFSRQTSRWLGFNMKDPLIGKNKNLRLALAHGIDFEKYLKVISNNTSLKANSIFNPSIPGYRPASKLTYEYNLKKAKEFLYKSGLNPSDIDLTYSTRGKDEIHMREAEFLKEQLRALGIDLKVEMISFSEFLKRGRAGDLQFWTDNWIYDYPDGENVLQLLLSTNHPGINKSAYASAKVDRLFHQMSQTLSKQERFKLMYDIEEEVNKDIPWVMLMYESTYILKKKAVKNFRKSFFVRNFSKYVRKD